MPVLSHPNYRDFLRATLAERSGRRGSYSVRAFARQLGFAQGFLADVLKGRKNLSAEGALRAATALGLSPEERENFSLLVQLETAKDESVRASVLETIQIRTGGAPIRDLRVDLFKTIAEWYHLAILEMTYLSGSAFTAEAISRRLGIAKIEAELAIERLIRLGLLEVAPGGKHRKCDSYVLVDAKIPTRAIRSFHRQVLEKLGSAIEEQSSTERFSQTEIYPIHPSLMKEADQILSRASREIRRLSERTPVKTEVYALAMHFFRLTTPRQTASPRRSS